MFVLDTNVVSELMRVKPDPAVLRWMDRRPRHALFTTAVTEAEIRAGIAYLRESARRRGLEDACERMFGGLLANRVLPFDSGAARAYAGIVAGRRRAGRPISQADAQILAIARTHGLAVATRNVRDFDAMGISVVNPWPPRA